MDAQYPPDPEWKYSGKETEEEIEQLYGTLRVLGVVKPTSDEPEANEEMWDLERTDLRMVTWNVNRLCRILRNGGYLKGLFQKWKLDMLCLQELRIEEPFLKKKQTMMEHVEETFAAYHRYLKFGTRIYSGVGIWVHKRIIERSGIPMVIE